MSHGDISNEEATRRLAVAISDFLLDQLITRADLLPEDRDCVQLGVECLKLVYGLDEPNECAHLRFGRPLLDIFTQVTNPVSVRDKLRADVHKDVGNVYMMRSMFPNAETEYTNAIELDRWNPIYYCNRACSRIKQHHYFEAIADCRQAMMLNPDYAKSHWRMGQAYALLHRPAEAARCFRQALKLEPDNERYKNNLIIAENQIDRPDAVGLITNLLNSVIGMRSCSDTNGYRNLPFPSSAMNDTECHPPRTDTSLQNIGHRESSYKSTLNKERNKKIGQNNNIVLSLPYSVINEGAEDQPVLQIDSVPGSGKDKFKMLRNMSKGAKGDVPTKNKYIDNEERDTLAVKSFHQKEKLDIGFLSQAPQEAESLEILTSNTGNVHISDIDS